MRSISEIVMGAPCRILSTTYISRSKLNNSLRYNREMEFKVIDGESSPIKNTVESTKDSGRGDQTNV